MKSKRQSLSVLLLALTLSQIIAVIGFAAGGGGPMGPTTGQPANRPSSYGKPADCRVVAVARREGRRTPQDIANEFGFSLATVRRCERGPRKSQ
jgi:hypothetical protein